MSLTKNNLDPWLNQPDTEEQQSMNAELMRPYDEAQSGYRMGYLNGVQAMEKALLALYPDDEKDVMSCMNRLNILCTARELMKKELERR